VSEKVASATGRFIS